jgi:hypothetical protein
MVFEGSQQSGQPAWEQQQGYWRQRLDWQKPNWQRLDWQGMG